MYKFSHISRYRLGTADYRWGIIMSIVIQHVDCTIIAGHRNKKLQNHYFMNGRSKLPWPKSKHNSVPSLAIDAVPYPIDWNDIERLRAFAFFVKGVAATLGYKIRLGADWDGDFTNKDQSFTDIPHMELII